LNEEQDGSDTLPVRREPLDAIIQVERAAAKKRMADRVAERLQEQERHHASTAAAMGLSLQDYLRTNKNLPTVRSETPEGETPLNMWRVTPCGDGFWECAAADSYSCSRDADAEPEPAERKSPVIAAFE
jgi:hypothetical protein